MRVVVFAPAVLHGDAWLALLTGQPGIEPAGGAAAVEELAPLLVPQGPTAVLVDLPVPDGDLRRRLRAAPPRGGGGEREVGGSRSRSEKGSAGRRWPVWESPSRGTTPQTGGEEEDE